METQKRHRWQDMGPVLAGRSSRRVADGTRMCVLDETIESGCAASALCLVGMHARFRQVYSVCVRSTEYRHICPLRVCHLGTRNDSRVRLPHRRGATAAPPANSMWPRRGWVSDDRHACPCVAGQSPSCHPRMPSAIHRVASSTCSIFVYPRPPVSSSPTELRSSLPGRREWTTARQVDDPLFQLFFNLSLHSIPSKVP